jgi:hypothetical protein
MSQPAFVPERHEVWFTDGTSGFYALHVNNWPSDKSAVLGQCKTSKRKTYRLRLHGVRKVRATQGKKRVRVLKVRRGKRFTRVTVSTRGLHRGKVRFRAKLKSGKTAKRTRSFRGCP